MACSNWLLIKTGMMTLVNVHEMDIVLELVLWHLEAKACDDLAKRLWKAKSSLAKHFEFSQVARTTSARCMDLTGQLGPSGVETSSVGKLVVN